jgi:hypothetical protein
MTADLRCRMSAAQHTVARAKRLHRLQASSSAHTCHCADFEPMERAWLFSPAVGGALDEAVGDRARGPGPAQHPRRPDGPARRQPQTKSPGSGNRWAATSGARRRAPRPTSPVRPARHLRRKPEPGKRRPLDLGTGGTTPTHPPSLLRPGHDGRPRQRNSPAQGPHDAAVVDAGDLAPRRCPDAWSALRSRPNR